MGGIGAGAYYDYSFDQATSSHPDEYNLTLAWCWALVPEGYAVSNFESSGSLRYPLPVYPGLPTPCSITYQWPPEQWPPTPLTESAITSDSCGSGNSPTFAPLIPWEHFDIGDTVNRQADNDGGYSHYKRTAQTRLELVVNGRALLGQPTPVLLQVSAQEFSNAGGGVYPNESSTSFTGDTTISPSSISINGVFSEDSGDGQNGLISVVVPKGATNLDVTPTAQTKQNDCYSFSENLPTLKITANGTMLDSITTNAEFCVGQQVIFSNYFDPPLPPTTPVQYQWTFQGEYVNEITRDGYFEESPIYIVDPALNTNQLTSLWWYNGGTNLVQCTCTIGSGDQMFTTTNKYYINIYRPTVSGFTNQSPRGFIADTTSKILSYGDLDTGESNMTWTAYINSKYDGRKGVTQIITADWWVEPIPGHAAWAYGCADASEFYDPTITVTNNISALVELDDIPAVGIGLYSGEILFTNTLDYIRFKPGMTENDNNIYVTLGVVRWNAHGRYDNVTSTMTDNYTPPASPPDSSDDFPEWECVKEAQ